MRIDGLTPRQYAYDIALEWLKGAHKGATSDLDDLTPSQKHEVKAQIAKLHNRLAEQAGLGVIPLGE